MPSFSTYILQQTDSSVHHYMARKRNPGRKRRTKTKTAIILRLYDLLCGKSDGIYKKAIRNNNGI